MPFPTPSADLMATAMGGPLLSTSSGPNINNSPLSASTAAPSKSKKELNSQSAEGTIRIFYSLKENPNAIISYADLIRQEQKRLRASQLPSSKSGGNASGPSAASTPTKNLSVKEGGTTQPSSSASAMDIDPPEGEEALGEADSEAEDEDDDDDEEENEDGTEAEDEDDDADADDDDDGEDDPDSGRREPKDFLEALTEKYAGLEEGNEGEDEDEDEDEDGKERVHKRPSRWDTEHYDIEDEFIDDSEMMLESIGMVRPKVDGFFAFRGPVETTIEDPDSSDAGPRTKRPTKRKQAGSSPLSTAKGSSKSGKGSSSLAVMENANDSTSELSEMDDKPKASKPSASSGLANSSTVPGENAGATDGGAGSATTTPTKKKSGLSRSKSAKDVTKEGAEASKDSDKDSKSGTGKKAKAKPSKAAAAAAASTATSAVTTPIVRVDSPPPSDNPTDSSAPPPAAPSRSSSPSRSKSKAKAPATTEVDPTSIGTGTGDVEMPAATAELSSGEGVSPTSETAKASAADSTVKSATSSEATNKSKTSKTLEPLNEDVQTAYTIVADLARKETWEVKARFPPHIKAPLFDCAKIALTTRSSGYVLEDNFFFHLQQVLPYNKFTLKKLIYKNVLPKWISDLEAQKTRLIEQFTTRVNIVWKSSGLADQPDKDGDGDVNMNEEGKPTKRFPWTQDLRLLLWETMEKFMEILAARQEFRTIDESQPAPFSDSKTRKDAYQTLLQSFPAGCMSSYEISRQYSQLKEKVQKQEKKETESSSSTASAGKPRPVFSSSSGSKGGGTATAARSAPVPSSGASGTRVATSTPAPATTPAAAPTSTSSPATQSTTTAASTSSTTSPPAAATHAPSSETPRDQSHMSSPSKSPSVVPRTASLSEIVHPTPQQPRQQHAAFVSEPMIGNGTSAANRKRKKSEEDITHGHGPGSHHNIPIKAEIPSYEEVISAHSYRHVGGSASEYPPPSSSPSMSPSNRAMYSSMMTEAAKKKRPQDQRQPSVPSSSGHITHHPVSTSGPYHPGARETMYHPRRPQSPPQAYSSHSSRVYPPPSQSSPHHHHYHHEPPPLSHHHRIASPGGSPSGSGAYSSGPAHPSSRPMTLPTGAQSSSVSPPSKAMSMSNLLHHPPSHHSRQGPM